MDSVLIRYHEIALKKGNRQYFTELLKRNLLAAVKDLGPKEVRSLPARLLLTFKKDIDAEIAIQRIRTVFGVANFSLVERTARDIGALRTRILESLNGTQFESFRIETQRGDKTFPLTSPEINRQLAAKGFNAAIEAIDFFTIGNGRPGIRIHQLPFRWVPNDPRRLADATNITYLVSDHLAEAET